MQPVQERAALAESCDCIAPLSGACVVCAKAGVQQSPRVRAPNIANLINVLLSPMRIWLAGSHGYGSFRYLGWTYRVIGIRTVAVCRCGLVMDRFRGRSD